MSRKDAPEKKEMGLFEFFFGENNPPPTSKHTSSTKSPIDFQAAIRDCEQKISHFQLCVTQAEEKYLALQETFFPRLKKTTSKELGLFEENRLKNAEKEVHFFKNLVLQHQAEMAHLKQEVARLKQFSSKKDAFFQNEAQTRNSVERDLLSRLERLSQDYFKGKEDLQIQKEFDVVDPKDYEPAPH